jgi:hypothetical protein
MTAVSLDYGTAAAFTHTHLIHLTIIISSRGTTFKQGFDLALYLMSLKSIALEKRGFEPSCFISNGRLLTKFSRSYFDYPKREIKTSSNTYLIAQHILNSYQR